MIKNIAAVIYNVVSSKRFFYVIIGLFILQAVWLALTVQYPQAFDESYHLGIIQVYSHQWLPFIPVQPDGASGFGDITRYDSYMYHYLMSFPYRLIAQITTTTEIHVIFLRLINIAMFAGGIIFFRRLFTRFKISNALLHVALLMFVLVPVVPTLAATINYDNMIFLLVPILAGLALTCASAIINHKSLPAASFILFLAVGFIGSLTQYAFVPVFVGAIIYLLILLFTSHAKSKILKSLIPSFKALKRTAQIGLIVALVISGGLFIERYGGNVVLYHSFSPDCNQVKPLSECLEYGPWARNYYLEQHVQATDAHHDPPILQYPFAWVNAMVYRLYFTINYNFREYPPLPVPYVTAWIIGMLGMLLSFVFLRSIVRLDKRLLLLISMTVVYIGGLFYVNFTEFLQYRTLVAVNGRYLIVVLPIIFIVMALAYQQLFRRLLKKRYNSFISIFATVILLLAMQGGGATTYLLRSQPIWYWKYKPLITINTGLKNAIAPFIIGSNK